MHFFISFVINETNDFKDRLQCKENEVFNVE